MKKIFSFVLAVMALTLSSCVKFSDFGTGAATLRLTLVPSGMEVETKTDGVDALNENKLEAIDIFLFKSGETTASVHKYITDASSATIDLTPTEMTALGSTNFDVFVIANLPAGTSLPNTLSKTNLESIALTMDGTTTQKSFVMKGEETTTNSGTVYSASVALARVAAKFSFKVTVSSDVPGSLDGDAGPWSLDTSKDIKLKFGGIQKTGVVGGNPVTPGADDLLESEYNAVSTVYYSYPRAPKAEQRPCAIIKVPFINGSSVQKDVYYKVFYPRDSFDSNVWYSLEVDIQELGATSEPEAQTVPISALNYSAAPWKVAVESGNYNQNTIIKDSHYLVVYSHSYTLENVNTIDIPFTSSHDCEIVNITANYTDFSTATPTNKSVSGDYSITIPSGSQVIRFEHTLDNNWLTEDYKNYDISPFVFKFTIRQKDDNSYKETITITQNPAITITAEKNENAYIFLNKRQVAGTLSDNLNGTTASGLGGHYEIGDQTPNMYIIRISALPDGCPFVIGDPRELTPYTSWTNNPTPQSAPNIKTGTNSTPSAYYKTRDDGTADNVIAPVFRTASGYSRLRSYDNSYGVVTKRAIAYQESQYPAGRWRLLTKAEAKVIAKLNHDGKIPQLFSDTNNFFCAGGRIKGATVNDGTVDIEGSVRLCYDDWYWSNSGYATCDADTFTWGDIPRNEIN